MEVTLDDTPESHDQSSDAEKDTSMEDSWSSSKELANLTTEASYNDHCGQGEMQFGELGMENAHTDSKASEKSCKLQQGAIFSGKILSFCCSECKGDTTYSPNDLLKHFQGAHKGTLPTYPCDLCTFVTNEFSSLQRHRIGHRDTLVTCEICNDGVQYSLLLLTRHFILCHSCNGLFRCKKCDFSTRDAGTFVQHIHHHNEGSHKCGKSPSQGKAQSGTFPFTCQFCGYGAARKEYLNKHLSVTHADEMEKTKKWMAIEGVNSPGLKLLLKKSTPAGGSRETQWMSKLNSLPAVDLLDGRLFNPEKTLQETQQFLERAVGVKKESSKWSKGTIKSESQCSYPVSSTTPQPKTQENEPSPGSVILNASNSNGLTVLMVKNKISIPPNCTTKVMGFKMVDGKKHLVLKVIPSKQEVSAKTDLSPNSGAEDDEKTVGSPCSSLSQRSDSLLGLDSGTKNDFTASIKVEARDIENHIGEQSPLLDDQEADLECSGLVANHLGDKVLENSSQLLTPPSASDLIDLDTTMTDEAEFSMFQDSHPDMNSTELSANNSHPQNSSASSPNEVAQIDMQTPLKAFNKHTAALDFDKEEIPSKLTSDEPKCLQEVHNNQLDLSASDALPSVRASNCTSDEAAPSSVLGVSPGQMCDVLANECSIDSIKDSSTSDRSVEQSLPAKNLKEKSLLPVSLTKEKQSPVVAVSEASSESTASTISSDPNSVNDFVLPPDSSASKGQASDNALANGECSDATAHGVILSDPSLRNRTSDVSPDAKDCNTEVESILQNSPSQEVFSFHNYSKETFGSSPDSLEADDPLQEEMEEDECEDYDELKLASDWSLTLPPSPPLEEEPCEEFVGSGGECNTADEQSPASGRKALERVSDSDIEVDECIATVDDDDPVLLEKEKEATCVSDFRQKDQNGTSPPVEKTMAASRNASALGKILEKHSDAIISQQLEKERMVSSTPTKTMLRILQTPEGKQQMFLQTPKAPYAVPVQLKNGPGFKLITKSCASKLNVSYVKPGIERASKGTGLSLTLNGGRIGMAGQGSNVGGKGHPSLLQAVGSGGRYFVNASALKGPLLLSSAVKSPSGEQTSSSKPTCYLVQRPQPLAPVSNESTASAPKTLLTTRPVLAMPVNSADKATTLQTGRQAYLVRYISPPKSGILLNNSDGKGQSTQTNEGGKSRVFLKIVRSPNGTKFLSTAPCATSAKKPIYVAASSLQAPYFLMSSNKSFTSLSAGLKSSIPSHGPSYKLISGKLKNILPSSSTSIKNRSEVGFVKSSLIPSHTRPRSQRKRRRRALFEESFETSPKSRRLSGKSSADKEGSTVWEPLAKDKERTLRLLPFNSLQQIKCPRLNQPVVVLNHPDADIPEVANIMRTVNRYKSEVVRVSLSQSTVKALSEWSPVGSDGPLTKQNSDSSCVSSRVRQLGSNVRERFILKLKFKKTARSKYEIVKLSSVPGSERMPTFSCWFCGRVFRNQEEWIGHGQRHLMEATRDWNKLF